MNSKYIRLIIFLNILQAVLVQGEVESNKTTLSVELDPLHDTENSENTNKEQEKRTIFNSGIKNVAWVKHTALKPSGSKYVLGYAPIDLKLRPVLRPIAFKGYHYNRPRIQLQIKRPIIQFKPVIETGWKPAVSVVKPVHVAAPVHVVKPAKPVHVHVEPSTHVDHVHVNPEPHVDHIHVNPVPHIDHVHAQPVVHVDHIHPVQIKDHIHHVTTGHIDHLHHVAAPQPIHTHHHAPFIPSAQLFEVTKPDLGVLPLGSVFQTTALKEIPAPHLVPHPVHHIHAYPVAPIHVPATPAHVPVAAGPPHVHVSTPVPVAPAPVPIAPVHNIHPAHLPVTHLHPVDHFHFLNPGHPVGHIEPVGQLHNDHIHPINHFHADHLHPIQAHGDHIHPVGHLHPVGAPQPGTQIEYHGAHFLNSLGSEQPPTQQLLPNHYHLQYPQIQQHQIPSNEVQNGGSNLYTNQQYPQPGLDAGQNEYPQQVPQFNGYPNQFQQEPNNQDHYPDVQDHYPNQQDENRYQFAHQVSNQQFIREGQFQIGTQNEDQGYSYPQPNNRFIQPGQTDLQFPLQLPNHPGFNRGYEQDNYSEASQQHERSFKPSIQLEPPFKK